MRHIDEGRIFVGCEGEELSIAEAVRITGNKPYVFSTDYPHEVDAETCKHELEELRENPNLNASRQGRDPVRQLAEVLSVDPIVTRGSS